METSHGNPWYIQQHIIFFILYYHFTLHFLRVSLMSEYQTNLTNLIKSLIKRTDRAVLCKLTQSPIIALDFGFQWVNNSASASTKTKKNPSHQIKLRVKSADPGRVVIPEPWRSSLDWSGSPFPLFGSVCWDYCLFSWFCILWPPNPETRVSLRGRGRSRSSGTCCSWTSDDCTFLSGRWDHPAFIHKSRFK